VYLLYQGCRLIEIEFRAFRKAAKKECNHQALRKFLRSFFCGSDLTGFENLSGLKPLYQYFSNLFNAYTKAYNKYHKTSGALFERPFKRKLIDGEDYLRQAVLYIHNNPVHHGFCTHPLEYPWSSYLTYISKKSTKLELEAVLGWFEDQTNFIAIHEQKIEREEIEQWLEL